MKFYLLTGAVTLALPALAMVSSGLAQINLSVSPFKETRYCGAPARDLRGQIIRRQDVLTAFKRHHPCPATGSTTGACEGWQIDHVIPLACGGCDAVPNLQWLDDETKAAKDRYERRIYQRKPPEPYTPTCTFRITP